MSKISSLNSAPLLLDQDLVKTKQGIWTLKGDTHFKVWIEQTGRLDHDQHFLSYLLPCIPKGGTAIDIGAFIGDHTHAYIQKAINGAGGKVYAFEPNPQAYECLVRNCPLSVNVNKALGHQNGSLSFNKTQGNYGASFVSASTSAHDLKTQQVETVRLDDFMETEDVTRLDFIKIDAEGYEPFILQGALKTLMKFRPIMCVEMVDQHLLRSGSSAGLLKQYLEKTLNYIVLRIDKALPWNHVQFDVLCIPTERIRSKEHAVSVSDTMEILSWLRAYVF